jgi:Tol biopolymer transport system component
MKANAIHTTRSVDPPYSSRGRLIALLATGLGVACLASAGPFQLLSTPDPNQAPSAGGGGDSLAPIISPDGRYVVFSSLANNLVLTSNGLPIPLQVPPKLNVFLRDRTNQTTTLVSLNRAGTGGGNGDSLPTCLSSNCQSVLFESDASDLLAGDTNSATDVFLRNLTTGTTRLVSISTNGTPANRASRGSIMTPDGRYVAFVSAANNLAAHDTNGIADVFVRDMQMGITTLASVGALGTGAASEYPDITPDGRYVAFSSTATNQVPAAVNSGDVYVRDLVSGTTTWASTFALTAVRLLAPSVTKVVAYNHVLSTNGQFVAYQASPAGAPAGSTAGAILRYNMESGLTDVVSTNGAVGSWVPEDIRSLDMTPDGRFIAFIANSNGIPAKSTCICVWDAQTGTTTLASGDLTNGVPLNSICESPSLSADGQFVLFLCSTNLVTNSLAGDYHVYVRDLQAATTTLVDADTNRIGAALNLGSAPQITADGRFVAFECPDAGLVANDRNSGFDVFVRDLVGGTTELISARDATLPSLTANGPSFVSSCSLSTDGRYAAFASEANNLAPGDTNTYRDIYACDLLLGTNILVSAGTNGTSANNLSTDPAISGNGQYVAFTSGATNLVTRDNNNATDVFVRDLQAGTTVLVSVNTSGTGPGNGASYSPVISADGRFVLFSSRALDLAAGSFISGYENLFLRDLQNATNYALTHTTSGIPAGAMTPDGRFVAFYGVIPGNAAKLYLWSSQSASLIYTNAATGITNVAVSPDGQRIAYCTSGAVVAVDRLTGTNWTILSAPAVSHPGLRFSGDGQILVYAAKASFTNQVFLYDLQYGTNFLVSHCYNSALGAYGSSDWPEISSDGRFIAYRSAAPNIVPGDTNGVPDVFLYDRLNNETTLLSVNQIGSAAGDSRSLAPVFSGDGRTLVFQSSASDMTAQDFNLSGDLFACQLYGSSPLPLFTVAIVRGTGPPQGPWLVWSVVPGKNYAVEFKNTVRDSVWQPLNGSVTILGSQAYLNDYLAGAGPRFYRVVAY